MYYIYHMLHILLLKTHILCATLPQTKMEPEREPLQKDSRPYATSFQVLICISIYMYMYIYIYMHYNIYIYMFDDVHPRPSPLLMEAFTESRSAAKAEVPSRLGDAEDFGGLLDIELFL